MSVLTLAAEAVEMAPRTGMESTKFVIAGVYALVVLVAAKVGGRVLGFVALFVGLFVIGAIWPPGPQPVENSLALTTVTIIEGEGS